MRNHYNSQALQKNMADACDRNLLLIAMTDSISGDISVFMREEVAQKEICL